MNAGYVYVLAFTSGTVKVGRTQNTGQRLNAHKSSARKFGLTLTDHWVSPPHVEWIRNEEKLKAIAAELGGIALSPEYFSGVDFAAVADRARELPFTPPVSAQAVTEASAPRPRQSTSAVPAEADTRDPTVRFFALCAMNPAMSREVWRAQAACMFLDGGVTPEMMRDLGWPIADVMDVVRGEEAKIRLRDPA